MNFLSGAQNRGSDLCSGTFSSANYLLAITMSKILIITHFGAPCAEYAPYANANMKVGIQSCPCLVPMVSIIRVGQGGFSTTQRYDLLFVSWMLLSNTKFDDLN
jgi:hypothetical protein